MKKIINSLISILKTTTAISIAVCISMPVYSLPIGNTLTFSASVTVSAAAHLPTASLYGMPEGQVIVNNIELTAYMSDIEGLKEASFVFTKQSGKVETQTISLGGAARYTWGIIIPREQLLEPITEYYLEVKDLAGNIKRVTPENGILVSNSLSILGGATGGTLIFPDANINDGEISMVIPQGALSKSTQITLRLLKQEDIVSSFIYNTSASNAPMIYELGPENTVIQKPIQITLLYYDTDQTKGVVDGTQVKAQDLKIYWWDGFDWRLVGGVVDLQNNTVTTSISRFGLYAVMSSALSASSYRPRERIITPNGDSINDYAQFDGLGSVNTEIKIFDVTGRKIRSINSQPYSWDGRDEDGRKVENGVYIYQFKVEGELISGVIAVAK